MSKKETDKHPQKERGNTMMQLTNDQIMSKAPSVFAVQPWSAMSERYAFVPTLNVIDRLREHNLFPVSAVQSRSRIEGKGMFTKHMIRFRQDGIAPVVGEYFPEVVLTNSHDGTSAYKLFAGIFRLLCMNGLVSAIGNHATFKGRHSGNLADEVVDATLEVVETFPALQGEVESFKSKVLSYDHRRAFGAAALAVKYEEETPITPEMVIQPKRREDGATDLWTTLNVVQENLSRGGQRYSRINGEGRTRRGRTRGVQSVGGDIRLNRSLWILAKELQKSA